MKKTLFLLLSLALTIPAFSQWDGTSSPWTQGTGTQSDPYQISSPQHLAYLADMVTSGVNDYNGKYFLLTQDISLSNQSWMPIGDATHPFKGNFDGGGHTIDSIYVFNTTYTLTGLFGCVENGKVYNINANIRIASGFTRGGISATVRNAIVENCEVILNSCSGSPNYFGGIVGTSTTGRTVVSNCIVSGNITGSSYVGGIVAYITGINAYIDNCQYSSGVLTCTSGSCGGINGGSHATTGIDTIVNCTNTGRVYGYSKVGGIVGAANIIYVSRCANLDSVVSRSSSYRNVCIGGIVGYANSGTIDLSSNRGGITVDGVFGHNSTHPCHYDITASEYRVYATGIGCGFTSNSASHNHNYTYVCSYTKIIPTNNLTITNCYNTGNIKVPKYNSHLNSGSSCNSNSPTDGCQVFGIGYNATNCYNTGTITMTGSGTTLYGYKWGASDIATNSYYIDDCGATTGGNSRSAAQMRSSSFPIILNADSTVFVMDQTNANNGYPVFWYTTTFDITTDTVTVITSHSANLNGHYGGTADTVGFIYGRTTGNTTMTRLLLTSSTSSPVSYTLTDLTPNTQYRYAFFLKHDGQYIYGDTLTFTTYPIHSVAVNSNNAAWGSVSGGGTFGHGMQDTMTATPNDHYQFAHWSDGNTSNPRIITVISDTSFTAVFEVAQYTINAVVNNSSWGSVTGTGVYDYNTPFLLTAIPTTGHHFEYWLEESTQTMYFETYNPLTFTATHNETYTAYFSTNEYTVNALSNNDTMGYVTGGGTYNYGQQIYIMAHPYGNYIFTQWSDGNTQPSRLITVIEDITYTAIFTDAIFNITASANNTAFGTVTGSGSYARGSQVQLTAVPNEGYHFTQWNDGNTDNPRTITVNADATYTAQFAANTYVLNVNSSNTLMGSATGGGIFSYGQQTTIEATAMPHYRFIQWNDGVNSNPRVVTITSDTTFTALFEQMPQYTITVISADETKGSVSGGGTFYGGEQTVINATAASGNVFDRWSDGNTEAIRTLTVTSDATYTAYFSGVRFTVNVYSNDDQMGSVSGGGEYEQGSQATVTATPANGCRFVRWNNGVETNPYTFTVYSNVNLIANFEHVTGVDEIEKLPFTIATRGSAITIYGTDNSSVHIHDILGRTIYTSKKYDGEWIDLRSSGVYLVSVDENKPIKIVIIN